MNSTRIRITLFSLEIFITGLCSLSLGTEAHALPAFAIREHMSCTACHTNGSAPHLTPFGYLYRRAGFRLPENIGNKEADDKSMNFVDHMAVGLNLDYEWSNNKAPGAESATMTSNQINVPEVEVWPLVGALFGNFAVWSEIDATPGTTAGASIQLGQADLRYVAGNADFFFNFRGGMMASEGFGASDQWLDDGNTPLMDQLAPSHNQSTSVLPFGAMGEPQLGFEFGLNYDQSHLTFGIYNGFSGVGVDANGNPTATDATPALMNQPSGLSKDYKVQLDQFIGSLGAVTAAYYNGAIPLMDPSNTFPWLDHYSQERLYLTAFAIPNRLDVLVGGSLASNQFVTGSSTPDGTFGSRGAFAGLMYYPMPHLSLAARSDYFQYDTTDSSQSSARGWTLQASVPVENSIFVFSFNTLVSDQASNGFNAGTTNTFRAVWRFLF